MVMRTFDCDVCVAGGGPAGLAAAIAAANRGLTVTVIDAARPPLDKACGEGLMPDALLALGQLGVDLAGVPSAPFAGIRFCGDGQHADALFPKGIGRGVRRPVLHQLLLGKAESLGVRFRWGSRITGLDGQFLSLDSQLIRAHWIIGADGLHSRIRRWSGLDAGTIRSRRVGRRLHYRIPPWNRFVEVHWGEDGQAYVTPVGPEEVCVAFISRKKHSAAAFEITSYPSLEERVRFAPRSNTPQGGITLGRKLDRVATQNVALIGDASGSVDAISGEGMALGFRQALALADALALGDLRPYESAHRSIQRVPTFMSGTMLLMDRFPTLRRHTFASFGRSPELFSRMLKLHIGEEPFHWLGHEGVVQLAWGLITA